MSPPARVATRETGFPRATPLQNRTQPSRDKTVFRRQKERTQRDGGLRVRWKSRWSPPSKQALAWAVGQKLRANVREETAPARETTGDPDVSPTGWCKRWSLLQTDGPAVETQTSISGVKSRPRDTSARPLERRRLSRVGGHQRLRFARTREGS
jgi:hypothetical protein